MINPRGAGLIAALIIIICGIVAGVVIGVPWPAVGAFALIALFVALKLVTKKRARAPEGEASKSTLGSP